MAVVARTKLSLRIFGEDLDPERITRLLGVPSDKCWRKGDEWLIRGHPPKARAGGAWFLESRAGEDETVEAHIVHLLQRLPEDTSVWRQITASFDADLYCGLFMDDVNEGFDLSHHVCRMLAERTLTIAFDIYGLSPNDDSARNSADPEDDPPAHGLPG